MSICKVPRIYDILGSNINISENILDAFYSLIPQPRNVDQEWHYCGKANRYNSPFYDSIYGAYPLALDWDALMYKLENVNSENGYFKHYVKEDVYSALEEFARGFQFGFDNFIKDKIETSRLFSSNEGLSIQKIADFISTISNRGGFSEAIGVGVGIFSNWYKDGIKSGYFYHAWYIVLDNYKLFDVLFASDISDADPFEEYLFFMKKNVNPKNRKPIMIESEYKRMVECTGHFLRYDRLPDGYKPIPKFNMTDEQIIWTFKNMYNKIKSAHHRPYVFYKFLNDLFIQLKTPGFSETNYQRSKVNKKGGSEPNDYKSLIKG